MHDSSCSCKAFILSWTQLKAERPRLHVDLDNLSQYKVSIPCQMKHVKLGLAKPEVTEVFRPKCPSNKSIQTFILSLQTDSIVAEHVYLFIKATRIINFATVTYLARLVSLSMSLELFVIQKLTNQIVQLHSPCQGSLLRRGLKRRLRDYPGYEVGKYIMFSLIKESLT